MSTLFNDVFPSEPLKQVFEYLAATTTSKIELRNYNNFCKQWKFVGQELVRDISVKVKERSLEQLSKNILAFVNRAKSISLVEVDEKKKMPYNIRDQVYYHHAWICILSNDKGMNKDFEYTMALASSTVKLYYIHGFNVTQNGLCFANQSQQWKFNW